eukprot:87-Pelagomonas_calceolata.AAC.2
MSGSQQGPDSKREAARKSQEQEPLEHNSRKGPALLRTHEQLLLLLLHGPQQAPDSKRKAAKKSENEGR